MQKITEWQDEVVVVLPQTLHCSGGQVSPMMRHGFGPPGPQNLQGHFYLPAKVTVQMCSSITPSPEPQYHPPQSDDGHVSCVFVWSGEGML
ncbi:hypothetical protein DAI22_12g147932 [Oryza sativa Japonica Group]|nr:hypothetical protein DAI22_12g147932 [Oryza sativa Japonica Group]